MIAYKINSFMLIQLLNIIVNSFNEQLFNAKFVQKLIFILRLNLIHHYLFSFIFSYIYQHISIYITLFKSFNEFIILAWKFQYIEISIDSSDSLAKSIGLLNFLNFVVIEFIPFLINVWTNKCVVVSWV